MSITISKYFAIIYNSNNFLLQNANNFLSMHNTVNVGVLPEFGKLSEDWEIESICTIWKQLGQAIYKSIHNDNMLQYLVRSKTRLAEVRFENVTI